MTGCALRRACALAVAALVAATAGAGAQEGPAQWLARIFDPATLQLEVFPGAMLNRKLSTDAIALERGGTKQVAIYIFPLDQVKAAAAFMAKQLDVPDNVISAESPFETHVFDCTAAAAPARCKGLRVAISRSAYVDNKAQLTMEYTPPAR
jgi:hypothetical protein